MVRQGLLSLIGHAAVIATVAAMTLAAAVPAVAETGSAAKGRSAAVTRNATDVSARRRVRHGGAGAVAIAAPRYRRAYDGEYECTPVHCGPDYKRGAVYDGHGAVIFIGR
jgi:uncharacterized low-complexity protein